jgi:hypothetical protein
VFSPEAPCSVPDLMNEADAAMYEAKRGIVIRLPVDAHR